MISCPRSLRPSICVCLGLVFLSELIQLLLKTIQPFTFHLYLLSDRPGCVCLLPLHHGTGDTSVPYVLSEILYAEITSVGLPVEIYLYEDDDHNLTNYFWTAMQRSVVFFDQYVKGVDQE